MSRYISILIRVSILIFALSSCRTIGNNATPSPQPIGISNATVTSDVNDVPPGIPVEKFSISTSHQTMPEDVLREISYYGMGGPGWSCGGEGPLPVYQNVTVISPYVDFELEESVYIHSCGWQSDELVHITIEFPDGRSVSQVVRATEDRRKEFAGDDWVFYYGVILTYETDWNDSPGSYTFTLEGDSGKVQHTVHITKPAGPRLHCDYGDDKLLLYNFEPNEYVRLFAYEFSDRDESVSFPSGLVLVLVAWQEYQVDSSGQLVIQVESGYTYAVIGDVSGDVYPFGRRTFDDILSFSIEANTGSDRLNVREGPGYNYHIVAQVVSGTQMKVLGVSRRVDGDWWWPICLNDGTEGWVVDTWVKRVE